MISVYNKKNRSAIWLPLLACFLWLVFTTGLYRQAVRVDEAHRLELEHTRLSTVARQLLDARNWNAAHGGVYVLESEYGRPNPWLPEGERTIAADDGRTLVLINPAYMSRQLAERNSEPGIEIGIISNMPLRPENLADAWENEALSQCTVGAREVFSAPRPGSHGKLRLLSVLVAQQSCLRCHVSRNVGEVLGGISVSQDGEAYLHNAALQQRNMRMLYGLLALTGVLAIGGLTLNLTRRRWLAEEASRMKSAFMARLSHDMRTPLTAILGMSELLQRPDVAARDRKKALRYLTQAGSALLEMVRDITDHATLEQGVLHLRTEPFSLRACLADCVALYSPVAEAKGLDIDLDVDRTLPDAVAGDSFRLRQALGNLVSNAVKFTELGRVRICVQPGGMHAGKKIEDGSSRLRLRILVQDTGPGLPEEDAERIFESFQRGSDAAGAPGTGLGLHIARTIARCMGGDVSVESSPGSGACFALEVCLHLPHDGPDTESGAGRGALGGKADGASPADTGPDRGNTSRRAAAASAAGAEPAAAAAEAAEAAEAAGNAADQSDSPAGVSGARRDSGGQTGCVSSGKDCGNGLTARRTADGPKGPCFEGCRILVAEDNEASRYIMEHMLRAEGARVCMAKDGSAALAALCERPWDLVVLDSRMPGVSGLEVLRAVREGRTCAPAGQRIVIYTAALNAEDRRICESLGADRVLLKPLTFSSLRHELAALLFEGVGPARAKAASGPGGAMAPAPVSAGASDASGEHAAWNRSEALAALDDDEDLLRRLARVLCQDLRNREAHVQAAQDAGDSATLRRLAHAVKNSAGVMRLDLLRKCAGEAETADDKSLWESVERMRRAMREALHLLDEAPDNEDLEDADMADSAEAVRCTSVTSQKGAC